MSDRTKPSSGAVRGFLPETQILSGWLKGLLNANILSFEQYRAAISHFRIFPDISQWRSFLQDVAALLGVLLFVAGLIMFFAWNWEDMPKWTKFATAEGVFVLLSLWAVRKWRSSSGYAALMGAGFAVGALMALYGQTYQTGADAWELFRGWFLVLLFLSAIALNRTGLWFMTLAVGNLWAFFWLQGDWDIDAYVNALWIAPLSVEYILAHIGLWALAECAHCLTRHTGRPFDPYRWLVRVLGMMATFGVAIRVIVALTDPKVIFLNITGIYSNETILISAALFFVVALFVYAYKMVDMFFVSLMLFSIGAILDWRLLWNLFERPASETGILAGVIVILTCFAVMSLILFIRKQSLLKGGEKRDGRFSFHQDRGVVQKSLTEWLDSAGIGRDALSDWFRAEEERAKNNQSWYVKIPMTLGIWIGSALLIAGVIGILFMGVGFVAPVAAGLILCASGAYIRRTGSGKWAALQFSLVLTVCGLVLIAFLVDESFEAACLLYGAVFMALWGCTKDPFGKAVFFAAALGALLCLLIYQDDMSFDYWKFQETRSLWGIWSVWRVALLILWGGLFVFSALELIEGRDKERNGASDATRWSVAVGFIIFVFVLQIFSASTADVFSRYSDYWLPFILRWAMLGGIVCAALLLALRLQGRALKVVVFAAVLLGICWFSSEIALGIMLLLLARYFNNLVLCGLASLYLASFINRFYYMMDIPFLNKSVILMLTGAVLTIFAFGVGYLLPKDDSLPTGDAQ